ncbi:hypothetical protein EGR52_02885 [bacterium]|nr:hypothetical protein [bacterium]
MNVQTQEIYSEVYSILSLLGESYIKKLPVSLFNMIKEEKRQDYNPKYDSKINLEQQNMKRETLSMIALFHLNYWCNSDEEKNELKTLFKTNEEKHQAEIREKYNPDNLFKKRSTQQEEYVVTNEVAMVEYKEPFLKRIFNKIKRMFHIN